MESCGEMGCNRPEVQPQDGAVRATQPCEGRRSIACVDAATQPRDGCAAGIMNQPGRLDALRPGSVPYSLRWYPDFRTGAGGATAQPLDRLTQRVGACPSGETIGRARLNPSGQTPGRLFGERGSILCSRSRIRGTGTLQVSRRETLEKPETDSIITRTTERMEGFGGGNRPSTPELLTTV